MNKVSLPQINSGHIYLIYNPCNITDGAYKGVGGWNGEGGGGGGWASQRRTLLATRPQTVVLCLQQTTEVYTNHKID